MDRHTLNHEQAAADLPAFVLDVLSRDEAEAVAAHLDVCSACQREQARLEWTLGLAGHVGRFARTFKRATLTLPGANLGTCAATKGQAHLC